jgi:hypothetical protein
VAQNLSYSLPEIDCLSPDYLVQVDGGVGLRILLYSESTEGPAARLCRIIQTFIPKRELGFVRTLEDLSCRLREPKDDEVIAVLIAASGDELRELLSLGDLLMDLRIILVLPNKDGETVANGHRLRPRFLTYADSNFIDVAAVLGKMLSGKGALR